MKFMREGKRQHCHGQAIVLLLAVLVVLASMAFWMLDTHTAILARLRAQDTGDPTVLAAARWQAAGLNLVGELNLIHAYMLADDIVNAKEAAALYELQQRIAITTPLLALQATQVTAKQNNATPLQEADEMLLSWVKWIEFPTYYEGATQEFLEGVHRILDNDEIYALPLSSFVSGANTLLGVQEFYEAVLADDYCWFWFNCYSFLQAYRNHKDFGLEPEILTSAFYALGIRTQEYSLRELCGERRSSCPCAGSESTVSQPSVLPKLNEQMDALNHPQIPNPLDQVSEAENAGNPTSLFEPGVQQSFMVYDEQWKPWDRLKDLPMRAKVKPEFDVLGAYTGVSIDREGYPWSAVAKPFGSVGGEPPRAGDLVLGGFDVVRLIPIDAVGINLYPYNPEWLRHLYHHIIPYSRNGIYFFDCRYCSALRKWDNSAFRQVVIAWLRLNGHKCKRPKTGSPSDTGGTHFAH